MTIQLVNTLVGAANNIDDAKFNEIRKVLDTLDFIDTYKNARELVTYTDADKTNLNANIALALAQGKKEFHQRLDGNINFSFIYDR